MLDSTVILNWQQNNGLIIISGLFILIEDQYTIGDTIIVSSITNTVEIITLHKTIIFLENYHR